ncbi:hypothetical protein DPMN_117904 [Dreissena polymorpha]|uniref:Uncharacterized protein n=1 Tax=Dreissena polymorpha TaxID=45954 RepID=A0A9D4GJ77_DREPO|nr:hypothetical protein DPMN_117904 [Dreissena polymorpha]
MISIPSFTIQVQSPSSALTTPLAATRSTSRTWNCTVARTWRSTEPKIPYRRSSCMETTPAICISDRDRSLF